MPIAALLLATLAALGAGWLLFVWMFEDFDSFLDECGWRHRDHLGWTLLRSEQPPRYAIAKLLFSVAIPALIVGFATVQVMS